MYLSIVIMFTVGLGSKLGLTLIKPSSGYNQLLHLEAMQVSSMHYTTDTKYFNHINVLN